MIIIPLDEKGVGRGGEIAGVCVGQDYAVLGSGVEGDGCGGEVDGIPAQDELRHLDNGQDGSGRSWAVSAWHGFNDGDVGDNSRAGGISVSIPGSQVHAVQQTGDGGGEGLGQDGIVVDWGEPADGFLGLIQHRTGMGSLVRKAGNQCCQGQKNRKVFADATHGNSL